MHYSVLMFHYLNTEMRFGSLHIYLHHHCGHLRAQSGEIATNLPSRRHTMSLGLTFLLVLQLGIFLTTGPSAAVPCSALENPNC